MVAQRNENTLQCDMEKGTLFRRVRRRFCWWVARAFTTGLMAGSVAGTSRACKPPEILECNAY